MLRMSIRGCAEGVRGKVYDGANTRQHAAPRGKNEMEDSLSDAPIRKHMHEVTRSELGATIHTRQECDPGTLARRTDQNPEVSRRESRFKVDRLLLTGILRECPNARSRLFLLMKDWKTHEIGRCGGLAQFLEELRRSD